MSEKVCKLPHDLSTNRVFQPTAYTLTEGLTNGIVKVQPLTKCNSAESIRDLRDKEVDEVGFHHYRPLKNEKYQYTLPNNQDGFGSWVLKPYELKPFTRLSLDDIDLILRCNLQRRRNYIQRMFNSADCSSKGFVTKASLLRIFHVLCPEMQMDQFHRLCERYCLNESPTLSFAQFETLFGVPPVGKTKAPEPKIGFGFDHKISVAYTFENMLKASRSKGFNLKEILPTCCFEKEGRILKPHLREMLARIRLQLTDENFRRLWEQKFDLEGVGSISTKQFLAQMGLTDDGIPKKEAVKLREYRFPHEHRANYKTYNGHTPILKSNPCPPMNMDPVSKPFFDQAHMQSWQIMPAAGGTSNPLPAQHTWQSKGPGGTNEPIMGCGTRYRDRMVLLRNHRPRFRNVLQLLKYIFEEPYQALKVVFQETDPEHKGRVTEARLFEILRECGLNVEPPEVTLFVRRLTLAVEEYLDYTGSESAVREGFVNYQKLLRRFQWVSCGTTSSKLIEKIRSTGEVDPTLRALVSLSAEDIEEHLVKLLHSEYIKFLGSLDHIKNSAGGVPLKGLRTLVEATIGYTMTQCQWDEFKSYLVYKSDGIVDYEDLLANFSKPSNVSKKETTEVYTTQIPPRPPQPIKFCGDPRDMNYILSVLERILTDKFKFVDKVYKHFDHDTNGAIDKKDFSAVMERVGFDLVDSEVNAIWRLMNAREPGRKGLHNYRQVMRFLLLETREIQFYRAMAKRAKSLHDPNILKMKDFRDCQRRYKKEHHREALALGKAAAEIKYLKKECEKPSKERVDQLCQKIRGTVVANWVDLRNGFLWQDPTGWGSLLRKDFRRVCEVFDLPLDHNELVELAHGLDQKNDGYVQYVDFLARFSTGHVPPKVGHRFDIVHHKLKNKKDRSEIGIREVMDKIRQICLSENNTLLAGFRAIAGPKHPEFVTMEDLECFLKRHGFHFSADDIYHLRTAYDTQRRGCIAYTDFLQQTMDVTKPLD